MASERRLSRYVSDVQLVRAERRFHLYPYVQALLAHNAKVYIATRNEQKSKAAIEELKALTKNEAIFLKLDLSDLVSVKQAAQEFLSKETKLHVLFNNA